MNSKILLTIAVLAVAICGASCAVLMAEESDAVNYTVTFRASTGGYLEDSYGNTDTVIGIEVASGTTYSASGDTIRFNGVNVTVRAIADNGYVFDRWSSISGTVNTNQSITAYFAESATQYMLIIQADPLAAGYLHSTQGDSHTLSFNVLPNSSYSASNMSGVLRFTTASGTQTLVTANSNTGYMFDSWSSTSGSFTSEVTRIYANYVVAPSSYTLTFRASTSGYLEDTFGNYDTIIGVEVAPDTSYSYSSSNNGISFIDLYGRSVTVRPLANEGYVFDRWSSTSGTVSSNTTITAYFTESSIQYMLIIQADPLAGGTLRSSGGEESHTLSFNVLGNSTYSATGGTFYFTTVAGVNSYVTVTANSGYMFDSWSSTSGTITQEVTRIYANFQETSSSFTLTFRASTGGYLEDSYGNTDTVIGIEVASGTTYSASGDTIRFNVSGVNVTVRAIADNGYVFDRWSSISGTVTGDTIINAFFKIYDEDVYWTNDNYNGRIDIIFRFDGNGSQEITGDLFTGSSSSGVANWEYTGLTIKTIIEKSGNQTRIGAELLMGDDVIKSNASLGTWPNVGSWNTFQVSLDPENARIIFSPVSVLNSFIDYKVYDTQARTMLSWGDVLESSAIRTLQHEASGDAPRFSVVGTRVFLDTYNAVLFDPRINVREKFPQYESVRLNFYSFALYGDSISVNGHTYPVTGDKVTITYIDKDGVHYAVGAVADGEQRTRDFTLSNIYVSWDALTGHCSLTFVDDRWTLDMGTYSHTVVSFAGMWFFYTMLYNSHLTEEKTLGDWKVLPDINQSQMILIYLGILAVAGVAGLIHARRGGHATLDLIIIGCAGLVGYIMLG